MTEQERFFDHKLYIDSCEIRDKAISTEEDEGSDERIGKYRFCFFHLFFVSGCRDHIESSKDKKSDHHRRSEIECEPKESIPDDSEFTEEVSLRDDTSPDLYESKKQKTKDAIEDTTFCFFLYFFVASGEDQSEKSPRKGEDRDTKDKYLEKTDNRWEKSIPEKGHIVPKFHLRHISYLIFWCRTPHNISEKDDIEGTWDI